MMMANVLYSRAHYTSVCGIRLFCLLSKSSPWGSACMSHVGQDGFKMLNRAGVKFLSLVWIENYLIILCFMIIIALFLSRKMTGFDFRRQSKHFPFSRDSNSRLFCHQGSGRVLIHYYWILVIITPNIRESKWLTKTLLGIYIKWILVSKLLRCS